MLAFRVNSQTPHIAYLNWIQTKSNIKNTTMKQLSYVNFYRALKEFNMNVIVYNFWANPAIDMREYGFKVINELSPQKSDTCTTVLPTKSLRALIFQIFLKKNMLSSM